MFYCRKLQVCFTNLFLSLLQTNQMATEEVITALIGPIICLQLH